jgi:hypothetical protein
VRNKTPMRCKFIGLCDGLGGPINNWQKLTYGVRAMIIRLDNHPQLGAGYDGRTVTSRLLRIDFECKVMVTQNSVYYWE